MSITPKNWSTFQHYKDRKPAWIKLHHALLDDYSFARLPVASRALAPLLWLLASEYEDGSIDASFEEIAFRLRMPHAELCEAVHPLIEAGFFILSNAVVERLQPASDMLAEPEPSAIPEKERETEVEREKEHLSEQSSDARKRERISYSEDFEKFWSAYPTDRLMAKKPTFDAWKRLAPEDRAKAISAVPAFLEYCRKHPDYRPVHAVRFLGQRRFDGFAETAALQEQIDWERRVLGYQQRQLWPMPWGPEPGYSGCRAPPEILEKYGYGRDQPGQNVARETISAA